jgi:hypothetical protein
MEVSRGRRSRMKRLLWAITLLPLAGVPRTYAQSLTVTQSSSNLAFTFSGGDNLSSQFIGPGVDLFASGDMNCPGPSPNGWCGFGGDQTNLPGTSLTPTAQLVYNFVTGSLTFGGHNLCQSDCQVTSMPGLGAQAFTFPTNGKGFTVTLPGAMEGFQVTGFDPVTGEFQVVNLGIAGPGKMVLNFDFVQVPPGGPPSFYRFTRGTFTTGVATPEPSTASLLLIAFAGLVPLARRRRPRAT